MRKLLRATGLVSAVIGTLLGTAGVGSAIVVDRAPSFIVSLKRYGEHACTATLVDPRWVLTTVRCAEGHRPESTTARVGSSDRTRGGEVRRTVETVVHEDYDLALLRLDSPVTAAPARVGGAPRVGQSTQLLGWGTACADTCYTPESLQQLDSWVVDSTLTCWHDDSMMELCTTIEDDYNTCADRGGPQVSRFDGRLELVGVVSRPENPHLECSTELVITSFAAAFAPWIDQVVRT